MNKLISYCKRLWRLLGIIFVRTWRVLLSLITALVIVLHGLFLRPSRDIQPHYFYLFVAFAFVVAIIMDITVKMVTKWLDDRYGWNTFIGERVIVQITFGILGPALLVLSLASVFLHMTKQENRYGEFLSMDYPFIVGYIICLDFIYIIRSLLMISSEDPKVSRDNSVENPGQEHFSILIVHYNGQHLQFNAAEDILCFYRSGRKVYALTIYGKRFALNKTIRELALQFSGEQFCQISRSTIVNYIMVRGHESFGKKYNQQIIIKSKYEEFTKDLGIDRFEIKKEFVPNFIKGFTNQYFF